MISEGKYKARAVQIETEYGPSYAQFGKSNNGSPQVVVNFEISEGDFMGDRIAWVGFFTPKTTKRTIESLRYCGFRGDDLAALVTQVLDRDVELDIKHEEYQGKTRARVNWVNKPGGGGMKVKVALDKEEIANLALKHSRDVAETPEEPPF